MIILPVLVPVISGLIGLLTLPYVQVITQSLGNLVNRFTELNPLLMSILICVTFSLLMVTQSLVAIATAINLTGLGSGAANMGIVAACVTIFLFGSLRVNSLGVNVVLLIGAAKMMIPVY